MDVSVCPFRWSLALRLPLLVDFLELPSLLPLRFHRTLDAVADLDHPFGGALLSPFDRPKPHVGQPRCHCNQLERHRKTEEGHHSFASFSPILPFSPFLPSLSFPPPFPFLAPSLRSRHSEIQVWLSKVSSRIAPDSRSSCIEGFVAQVGPSPTDEKRSSVSRAHSSWAGVGDDKKASCQQHVIRKIE